ncbi:MAG: TIGR02677 family protein, partial [Alicyclobacillus sp.]|nr:TIGR02677 family protein [Alicyclobacillus sp.]
YGGSLEPNLLERIVGYVLAARSKAGCFAEGEALQLWRDLQTAFRQLHENASDYLASLQSARAEELMLTSQFLAYKETLTRYLRNFVVALQTQGSRLEGVLRQTEASVWHAFIEAAAADELRTPVLDDPMTPDERLRRRCEEWDVFVQWFVGTERDSSDLAYLERQTKDTIARIVRYALAIQERQRWGVSRKRELDYLGQWFLRLDCLEDAHRLAACTFGLFRCRHFQGVFDSTSDSADLSMWDEVPFIRTLGSRSRARRRAGEAQSVAERRQEQLAAVAALLAEREAEWALLRQFADWGSFSLSELPPLHPRQRAVLLDWISRCMANPSLTIHTPQGLEVRLSAPPRGERARLAFVDGTLDLPDFRFAVR